MFAKLIIEVHSLPAHDQERTYGDFELNGAEERPLFEYFEEGDVSKQCRRANQWLVSRANFRRLRQFTQMTRQNTHHRTVRTQPNQTRFSHKQLIKGASGVAKGGGSPPPANPSDKT